MIPVDQRGNDEKIYRLSDASLGSLRTLRPHIQHVTKKHDNYKQQGARLDLQDYAAKLLPGQRVSSCCRHPAPIVAEDRIVGVHDSIDVTYNETSESASFSNLQICDSVWHCPVCSARISEQRRVQLTNAMNASEYHPMLVTLTLRHNLRDKLPALLKALLGAYRSIKSGRFWQDFKDQFGWVGDVRALEVTYGQENGWHPHIHVVMLLEKQLQVQEMDNLRHKLREKWLSTLIRHGFDATYENGVDVRDGDRFVQEYLAKFGKTPDSWSVQHELTKSAQKTAFDDHRTPFQLLADYAKGDKQAGALFREYALAFKGRNQLVWSRGLKHALDFDSFADEEDAPGEPIVLASIHRGWWALICRHRKRSALLAAASTGNQAAVEEWLTEFVSYFARE